MFSQIFAICSISMGFAILLSTASPAASTVGSALSLPEVGLPDAITEACFTILAFFVAACLIQYLKLRNRKIAASRSALSKAEKVGIDTCTSECQQNPASANDSPSLKSAPPRTAGNPTLSSQQSLRFRSRAPGDAPAPHPVQEKFASVESEKLVAAVRVGRAAELPVLLDAALARVVSKSTDVASIKNAAAQHLLSALRACASHQRFHEALVAYDHAGKTIGQGFNTMWSLLLYCAVETQEFHRCNLFFRTLLDHATPSASDFLNMVRYHVYQHDVDGLRQTLFDLNAASFQIDAISRNRALSVCLNNNALRLAEVLADDDVSAVALDTVGFNTLIKGFSRAGEHSRCFHVYEKMQRAGMQPSDITYGIMLDACIAAKDLKRAKQVFNSLRESGLKTNVVHYTTFMKGLLGGDELQEASDLLDEMLASSGTKPDLVTYSTLVKAHADSGRVMDAVKVLERMLGQGIRPDVIIYNIVLTACTIKPMDPDEIFHVYQWLVKNGLQTSTTTLSILVKALGNSQAYEEALNLLSRAPEQMKVWPEARLYGQLAQACAKVNNGIMALETYRTMVKAAVRQGSPVDESTNARLFRVCSSCGQADAAEKIYQAVCKAGGYPKVEDVANI